MTLYLVTCLAADTTRTLDELRLRDPCLLADEASRTYYLVTSNQRPAGAGPGVSVLTSRDLAHWSGPVSVFDPPAGFWGGGFWAPELHCYRGRYYLFVTCHDDTPIGEQWPDWPARIHRGTMILHADSPLGPFVPFRNDSHTPATAMTLDGTLWLEDGVPYMVYCHEWVELRDGSVEMIRLSDDLSRTVGEPTRLFLGSDGPLAPAGAPSYVTDGPWLHRTASGVLLMLWSSFSATGYTTYIAQSESGRLAGPWRQQPQPLFTADGGHAMLFRAFDGRLMLSLHQPNRGPDERARIMELVEDGATVRVR